MKLHFSRQASKYARELTDDAMQLKAEIELLANFGLIPFVTDALGTNVCFPMNLNQKLTTWFRILVHFTRFTSP
jgi:hypothetical protein